MIYPVPFSYNFLIKYFYNFELCDHLKKKDYENLSNKN